MRDPLGAIDERTPLPSRQWPRKFSSWLTGPIGSVRVGRAAFGLGV
ncbi:MAG: hypothetical protein IV100_02525 [Myxococcales bacterium]|nr:hypothetical protein [Myxococcales bacterium]